MRPVLLLTLIFFIHFVARQIAGPMLPVIEAELALSHTQSGLFILAMGLGFFISQLSAPFLTALYGYRRCILVSLCGSAFFLVLVAWAGSSAILWFAFLCMGITGGLYVPAAIALITVLVHPQDWGKALGIHELAPNLALILVPFLATAALTIATWRQGYLCLAAVFLLMAGVYFFAGVDAHERPSAPNFSRLRDIVRKPAFWQLGVLLSLAVGVETGVYAMTPLFLVNERGFTLADANQLLGLSRVPGLIMVLLAGWITDRLNPVRTVSIALGLTGVAVICLGVGPRALLAPAVYVQAAAAACLFPPILSMTSKISSQSNRALTLSLSLAVAPVVGGGLIPAGIALAGDLGSFGLGLLAAGLLTTAGIALVRKFK
jgi:NNP family nitrate/nitrite transporter-like MFS transporter